MSKHSTRVECVCETCGQRFRVKAYRVKRDRVRFCNRKCVNRHGPHKALVDRFLLYVRKADNGCIIWTGAKDKHGYGRIGKGSVIEGTILAHRASYELFRGPTNGMDVLHNCPDGDNPSCVNPCHLFLGTQNDNMADAAKKGRTSHGEDRPLAKLTDQIVLEIRRRYASGTVTQRELAAELDVGQSIISQAINGVTWKHLPLLQD